MLMIKSFRLSRDMDFEHMGSIVGSMRFLLEAFASGQLPDEDYTLDDYIGYISSLPEKQWKTGVTAGSWTVAPEPEKVKEDERLDFIFFPSWCACASISWLIQNHPEKASAINGLEESLVQGLKFSISENLEGFGITGELQTIEAALILGAGGLLQLLKKNPHFSPELKNRLDELKTDYRNKLDRGETDLPYGGSYKEIFEQVCRFLEE